MDPAPTPANPAAGHHLVGGAGHAVGAQLVRFAADACGAAFNLGLVGAAAHGLGRRQPERPGVTPHLHAGGAHPGELRLGIGDGGERNVELVGEGGSETGRPLRAAAADDERRVGFLHGLG